MEELLNAVKDRTGLPADKAKEAVEAVLDFLKNKLPGGLGNQLEGMLEGNADRIGDALGGITDKLKGLMGQG